jgi:putative endonuclease
MIYIYILQCADNTYYTGITKDLDKRFEQHSSGKSKSTRHKRPLILVHSEVSESYKTAAVLERHIKNTGAFRYLCKIKFSN